MSKSNNLLVGAIIFILALTGINIFIAIQISSEHQAISSQLVASRQPPAFIQTSNALPGYTHWYDSGDNPPHCWWYQFLAPIGTLCYQNDRTQPKYGTTFVMSPDYYASVNSQVAPTPLQIGNFPPLTGAFPMGSLKAQTITNNSTTIVEGKVAGLVLKDGQLSLTFQDKTTDGISSITVDSAKVNLTAIHVGSVIRTSIITTTTTNVYTTMVAFTLLTIDDYQGICQWQTPYGTFSQTQFYPPPSTACLRYTSIGGTISPGSTFWTVSTTTKTTIESFQVISK